MGEEFFWLFELVVLIVLVDGVDKCMGYCFWSIVVYFEFCVEGIDGRCIEGGVCGVWREILEV